MSASSPLRLSEDDLTRADQRVTLHDVPWEQYEALLAVRGESPNPRMTYLDGTLELMSPSIDHELLKKTLARLIEAWADERDLPLRGFGSWTVRKKAKKRGAEADECYSVGGPRRPERPDLAIEVVWTHGGIDKLEVWRGLGVREVWVWEDDRLDAYVLGKAGYERRDRSTVLPELDLALLARLALLDQPDAVRALRAHLRGA
jgi:Uma2 family endonuclease